MLLSQLLPHRVSLTWTWRWCRRMVKHESKLNYFLQTKIQQRSSSSNSSETCFTIATAATADAKWVLLRVEDFYAWKNIIKSQRKTREHRSHTTDQKHHEHKHQDQEQAQTSSKMTVNHTEAVGGYAHDPRSSKLMASCVHRVVFDDSAISSIW